MPSAVESAAADGIDDIFNYDVDEEDVFRPFNTSEAPSIPKSTSAQPKADLGLDEEVKTIKKRTPIPKLDENRLLSQNGVPKLRKITKSRLKLKGKGHEFSDVARMLALYQLWLDDLYPRAKFADGLAIIEKLGHSRRMQTMRREWINEGKNRMQTDGEPDGEPATQGQAQTTTSPTSDSAAPPSNPAAPSNIDASETEKATAVRTNRAAGKEEALFVSDDEPDNLSDKEDNGPSDDELDQLLAEDEATRQPGNVNSRKKDNVDERPVSHNQEDEFAAEMEVMAEMSW